MPEKQTLARAQADKRQGKAPSTQAGEFVKEEMDHVREGVHGARSTKQAIAIGLSKARRAGVALPPPKSGKASDGTRRRAARELAIAQRGSVKSASAKRSSAALRALKHEGNKAASSGALGRHARVSARNHSAAERSAAAERAARTRQRNKSV